MNHVDNYIRKINSAFQGGGNIKISTFVDDHIRARPILHPLAAAAKPDISALVYSILRLPPEIFTYSRIVLGQSDRVFRSAGLNVSGKEWKAAKALARARRSKANTRNKTLAVFLASISDLEDLVTILTAFYIEVVKLNEWHGRGKSFEECFKQEDLQKISEALGDRMADFKRLVASPINYELALLAGSNVDYSKAVQEWWINIAASRKKHHTNVYRQPIYFVSSNSHSLINLLSGFPVREKKALFQAETERLTINDEEFKREQVAEENICYYLSRFVERSSPDYLRAKQAWEFRHGLLRLPPVHNIDIEAQLFSVKDFIGNVALDRRIALSQSAKQKLLNSDALILNIAYPLGLSAYGILREVSENAAEIRGVYIMGKAASLNAGIGDITFPSFVYDMHTYNQIFVENCLGPGQVAPFFPKSSIFSNQKAVSVRGTYLQNESSLGENYRSGYSIIEMEAGPYLNRIYEMQYPERYPTNETFVLNPGFRLGLAYYVSDTPHNKGVNLGAKRLTWEGLNATYAISLAIINDILATESAEPHPRPASS